MYMQHLVRHVFQNSLGFLLINDHMAAGRIEFSSSIFALLILSSWLDSSIFCCCCQKHKLKHNVVVALFHYSLFVFTDLNPIWQIKERG